MNPPTSAPADPSVPVDPEPHGPPPWLKRPREFLICCRDIEGDRSAGFGLTLDKVLEEELAHFRERGDGVDEDERGNDLCVWEGWRLVAVIMGRPGCPVRVHRYDNHKGREKTVSIGTES